MPVSKPYKIQCMRKLLLTSCKTAGEHPIHLHGHWAFVMAAGAPEAGDYTDDVPLQPTLIRDTVTVNSGSYLVLRVIAENPGVWIIHCQ